MLYLAGACEARSHWLLARAALPVLENHMVGLGYILSLCLLGGATRRGVPPGLVDDVAFWEGASVFIGSLVVLKLKIHASDARVLSKGGRLKVLRNWLVCVLCLVLFVARVWSAGGLGYASIT